MPTIKDAIQFKELREEMRGLIGEVDRAADAAFGKREPKENFPTDASFEPEKNKVVPVADVLAAVNLIVAHFMVRTWPTFIATKIREYVVGRIASAVGKSAVAKIAAASTAKAATGALGTIVGAFGTNIIQQVEMKGLEKLIRASAVKVRRELNASALNQARRPSRIGVTSTRNG